MRSIRLERCTLLIRSQKRRCLQPLAWVTVKSLSLSIVLILCPRAGTYLGRGGGTRTHTPSQDPDFKSGASANSATPPRRRGVYQSGMGFLEGAAGFLRVGIVEALEGPLGYRVGYGAGEVDGVEGVETLHVAARSPDAGHAGAGAGEVPGVDLFDRLYSHGFPGGAHAACGLQARDSPGETGAGDPEARRHVAGPLVLYDARRTERATGRDAEGSRRTAELAGYGLVAISHELLSGGRPPRPLSKRNQQAVHVVLAWLPLQSLCQHQS